MILRKTFTTLSIALLAIAPLSTRISVAMEEFTEDFSTAVDRAYSPLTGHVSSNFSLKQEDILFQIARQRSAHKSPELETFQDFIRRNKFFGRPILLRLDPPDEYTARKDLTSYLKEFQDAGKQVELLTKAFDLNQKDITTRCDVIAQCTTDIEAARKNLFQIQDSERRRLLEISLLTNTLKARRKLIDRLEQQIPSKWPQQIIAMRKELNNLKKVHSKEDAKLRNLLAEQNCPPEIEQRENLTQKIKQLEGILGELRAANSLATTIADAEIKAVDVARVYFPNLSNNLSKVVNSYSSSVSPLLKDNDGKATYLLILNYNIPALRTTMMPFTSYSQVRFCNQLMTRYRGPDAQGQGPVSKTGLDYDDVSIVTIWPRNQVITANFTNTKTLDLKAEPQWMGASGGSIDWKNEDKIGYSYALPMTVGSSSKSGALQWTMYPAKRQKIAYGNHTAFAVISIPRSRCQDILQVNSMLYYNFKLEKAVPFFPSHREFVTTYIPFKDAIFDQKSIELVGRVFGRTLSGDDETLLERIVRLKDPADPTKVTQLSTDDASSNINNDSDQNEETDTKNNSSKTSTKSSSKSRGIKKTGP